MSRDPVTADTLRARVAARRFLLLDGAIGTELKRRGADMVTAMDLSDVHDDYWTGKALLTAPSIVRELHEDYLG
ncbi:MAG: homocysteine S-methyltransferase family protein, partial [Candidatus Rokuibacteriota bacterium]